MYLKLFTLASFLLSFNAFSDDSSTSARSTKVAGIAGRYGFVVGGVSGYGVDAFYNHDSDWQFGLAYATGKLDVKPLVDDSTYAQVDYADIYGQILAAQARYFLGNSFNLYGQIGQRVYKWDLKVSSKVSSDFIKSTGKATSMYAGLGVGNTWAWDCGLFVGIDWLGYFIPFGSSSESSNTFSGTPTSDMEKINTETQDLGKKLGNTGHFQLLVLNLGFSF